MAADETIRPLFPRERAKAAAFLFGTYRDDPRFAELYGVRSADELDGIAPLFRQQIETMTWLHRATLGCFHGSRLVGAISYYPDATMTRREKVLRVLQSPVQHASLWVHHRIVKRRFRVRLPPAATQRWQAYGALTAAPTADSPPRLQVMALGVAADVQRTGIARRLLDTIANEPHWQQTMQAIDVNTWHPEKVSIYERLGFATVLHAARDGVACWTMRRPIAAPARETDK